MAAKRQDTPTGRALVVYDLVVSRGYVQLVRRGADTRRPPRVGTSFRWRDGRWGLDDPAEHDSDVLADFEPTDSLDHEEAGSDVDPFVAARR